MTDIPLAGRGTAVAVPGTEIKDSAMVGNLVAAGLRAGQGIRAVANGADWRDEAACRHVDPDLFFPIGNAEPALRQIGDAKRICQACSVRMPCLAWALVHGADSGVWGGATEDERGAIRRALRRDRSRV